MALQTRSRKSNYHKVFEAALRLTPDEQQRLREDLTRLSAVHLVPPALSVTAKKKGKALADEVRAELVAQKRNESLDETMQQLRGRAWSS